MSIEDAFRSVRAKAFSQQDANLIATAPEMLEFLEETLENNRASSGWGYRLDIYKLHRIIVKAKGEE